MAVDTPAKIAILGAGPIGLEAALYARYLGYEVEVFERQRDPWWHASRGGSLEMLTPFGRNRSTLGLRAILAQDESYQPPGDDEYLTVAQWQQRYVGPLAETDLIADCIRLGASVRVIGKVELTKTDTPSGEFDRGAWDFRLLVATPTDEDRIVAADVVFDCTGVEPLPWIGHGGIRAPGELALASEPDQEPRIEYGTTDVFQRREAFQGAAVLVIGEGVEAAEAITQLAELADQHPATTIVWVTRHESDERPKGPLPAAEDDTLPRRRQLLQQANELAMSGRVKWLPGRWVEALERLQDGRLTVHLSGESEQQVTVDRILALQGHRPDWSFSSELQLEICPITDAPRPFSGHLLRRPSPYSVEYPAPDAQALITSEPNYYVLGRKSFGRAPGFLYAYGLRQIRDIFTLVGDRSDLDLYK